MYHPFVDNMSSTSTRSNMRRRNSQQTSDYSDNESDKSVSTNRTQSTSSSRKRSRTNSNASIRRYSDDEHDIHSQCTDSEEEKHVDAIDYETDLIDLTQIDEEYEREMSKVYRQFGEFIKLHATSCLPYIKQVFDVSSIYLFWIALRFVTAQLYVQFCAYPSLYGFLLSPFLISSPHCAAMRWIFTKGGTLLDGMWIILGTWLCSKVLYRDV